VTKVTYKLLLFPKSGTGWSSTSTTITNFYGVQTNDSVGSGKDRFSFRVKDNSLGIDYEDKIEIYRITSGSTFTSDDLLMSGVVRTVTPKSSFAVSEVSISGYNYSESVMSGLVFVDAIDLTVPEMFKQAIISLQTASKNFSVTWDDTNPTAKTDLSPFPVVGETLFNKPFRELLDKYSRSDRTEDGNYHWYVSKDNKLVWNHNKDATSGYFDETDSVYTSLSVSKDVNDVKNYVVVKGGYDPKGRVLQTRCANYPSISKHGFKYYILTSETKTGASVLDLDMTDAGVDDMADASYPFTPRWSTTAATSYNNYSNLFNTYMMGWLEKLGDSFIDGHKNGKLKVTVVFKPANHSYVAGNAIQCTFSNSIVSDGKMRVNEINRTLDSDIVIFEEDEGSL